MGGRTRSMVESFAENQKQQRAAKSVFSVNANCFRIPPLCGLQLPLSEEHSLPF